MKLVLVIHNWYCATRFFEINGINASSDDFGYKKDLDEENAEDYCCANMRFIPKPSTQEILDKYGITEMEYKKIANELEQKLSFGCCGLCS